MNKIVPYVSKSVHWAFIVFLLWLTLLPVEVRWAYADVVLTAGVTVAAVVGVLCVLCSGRRLRVTAVDGLVMLWSLYYICRAWIGAEFPCGTDFLKSVEMILLYFVLRVVLQNTRVPEYLLIIGIVACGCYEACLGIYQLFTGTGRHHLFLLTGSFQNPGPYSAYLMIAAVVGLYSISVYSVDIVYDVHGRFRWFRCFVYKWIHKLNESERANRVKAYLRDVFIPVESRTKMMSMAFSVIRYFVYLPLLILPATWSRAAFVGVGICALWIYRRWCWKYRYYLCGTFVVIATVFYFIKQGSADGRALIWLASLTSWLHNVWLGVGIGGFRHACAEGIAEMWRADPESGMFASAGVTDYAYNALLKIFVEQGLVGSILCVSTVALALVRLYRRSVVLFLGMMSLLIFSMFSYPFELLPYNIIVVLIVAWCESRNNNSFLSLYVNRFFMAFIACVIGVLGFFLNRQVNRHYEADKDCVLFSGMRNAAFLFDYYELLPYEQDNPQYLFDFAKTLREEKRYMDSNAILRRGTVVSADPMFYIIMGNNYRDDKYLDLAEQAYRKAYSIMPNRLYPLYQLMMMYEEVGDEDKLYNASVKVAEASVKIESKATEEMRQRADSICSSICKTRKPKDYSFDKLIR